MKLYRAEYYGAIGGDGLFLRVLEGEEVVVNGTAMVGTDGLMFLDKRGLWVESRSQALEQAAGIVDGVILTLVAQAAEFRRLAAEAGQ